MAERKNKPYFVIDLQWPYKELSPNHKAHWAEKGRWVKQARADAYQEAQYQAPTLDRIYPNENLVSLRIFYPPTTGRNSGRQWDSDNLGASLKAYQDGLFDFFRDRIDPKMDDRQVISTVNYVVQDGEREKGLVHLFIFGDNFATWIEKVPAILSSIRLTIDDLF
jgi:crossover junction endodeoxyribonuclease RusA